MPTQPISLSAEEYEAVQAAAAPVHPRQRDDFLNALANNLSAQPAVGPGLVYRLCASLQSEFLVEARAERRGMTARHDAPRDRRRGAYGA